MHGLDTIKKLNGEYPGEEPLDGVEKFPYDVTAAIIAYEEGEMNKGEVIYLFQYLVNTGLAWQLQGSYGREAVRLINAGLVSYDDAVGFRQDRDFAEAKREPLRRGNCAP